MMCCFGEVGWGWSDPRTNTWVCSFSFSKKDGENNAQTTTTALSSVKGQPKPNPSFSIYFPSFWMCESENKSKIYVEIYHANGGLASARTKPENPKVIYAETKSTKFKESEENFPKKILIYLK